jgi:hypothetical protein
MKLQVTEKHLDRAIDAVKTSDNSAWGSCCVLAQAVMDKFNTKVVSTGTCTFCVNLHNHYRIFPKTNSRKMVSLFDGKQFDKVREMLPLELQYEESKLGLPTY